MLNFAEIKENIGKIVGLDAEKVLIGFLTRVYEITFDGEVEELTREKVNKIVTELGRGVVKTVDFVSADKKSVVVAFHMN